MSRDFLAGVRIFGSDVSPRAAELADPACADCVTFVAGPPPASSRIDAAWLPWTSAEPVGDPGVSLDGASGDADRSPLAHLFTSNPSLRIEWESVANPGPAPSPDDEEAVDAYARAFGAARFARRVLDGDPAAWVEALATYRERFRLPAQVRSTIRAEEDGSLRVAVELPAAATVPTRRGETQAVLRARYHDLCAAVVLAFACDVFRVLPAAADSVYVVGYRRETDPATGHPRYAILTRLATDRASLAALDLTRATPSAALEYLGGAAKTEKGEIVPLAYETEFSRVM